MSIEPNILFRIGISVYKLFRKSPHSARIFMKPGGIYSDSAKIPILSLVAPYGIIFIDQIYEKKGRVFYGKHKYQIPENTKLKGAMKSGDYALPIRKRQFPAGKYRVVIKTDRGRLKPKFDIEYDMWKQ